VTLVMFSCLYRYWHTSTHNNTTTSTLKHLLVQEDSKLQHACFIAILSAPSARAVGSRGGSSTNRCAYRRLQWRCWNELPFSRGKTIIAVADTTQLLHCPQDSLAHVIRTVARLKWCEEGS
jgi:hypothetical protein